MFILWGTRTAGRVHARDGRLLSTLFLHVSFVPVFPLQGVHVARKRLLLDEGERVPLSVTSVLAGYLRTLLFGGLVLGYSMMADGLFVVTVSDEDRTSLAIAGAAIFFPSAAAWLWAVCLLGARREETARLSPGQRFSLGLLCLAMVSGLTLATAALLPKEPTLRSIASDTTLSDEQAVGKLAEKVFPEGTRLRVAVNDDGIHLNAAHLWRDGADVSVLPGQNADEAARLDKALAVFMTTSWAKDLIEYGRARRLAGIRIAVSTTVLDENGCPIRREVYRVGIPRERFDDVEAAAIITGDFSIESLLSRSDVLEELGVVELDRFDELGCRQ